MEADLAIPCLMDQFNPETAWNLVAVLAHFDIKAHYNTAQTCCGFAAHTAGQQVLSSKLSEKYIDEFSGLRTIICPDQSCHKMVRDYMAANTGNITSGNKQKSMSKLFRTLTDLLAELPDGALRTLKFKAKVTMMPSCQCSDAKGESSKNVEMLQRVVGLKVVPMEHLPTCCGFGGSFHLTHSDLADQLASEVFREVINVGADYLICDDSGCHLHLKNFAEQQGIPVVVWHVADLLAEAIKEAKK